jgi:hypothetical protein
MIIVSMLYSAIRQPKKSIHLLAVRSRFEPRQYMPPAMNIIATAMLKPTGMVSPPQ